MRDDGNPPVWAYDRRGAEAYYLEHYEEIERRYLRWCHINCKDPEATASMVEYEETYD